MKMQKNKKLLHFSWFLHILNVTELPEVFWTWGDQAETCAQLFYVEERFYGFEKPIDL